MNRNVPLRTTGGAVIQSGLDARPNGSARPMTPRGVFRAVVLSTYVTDDPENLRKFQVECDLLLVRSMIPLRRVPVMQRTHGYNNADPWIPKPSTRVVTTNEAFNLRVVGSRGAYVRPATALSDLDGDQVLVTFLEGDGEKPIIIGAMVHERTKRLVVAQSWSEAVSAATTRGKPGKNEHYSRHAGTEVRINEQGDLLIDTVGATTDEVNEAPTAAGGAIRFRAKATKAITHALDSTDMLKVWLDGALKRVDIAETPTQAFVRGNDQEAALRSFLDAFDTWAGLVQAAFASITGPPGPLNNVAILAATATLRSALTAALSLVIRGR